MQQGLGGRTHWPPWEDWRPEARGGYVGCAALVRVFGDAGFIGDGFRDQVEENDREPTFLGLCKDRSYILSLLPPDLAVPGASGVGVSFVT